MIEFNYNQQPGLRCYDRGLVTNGEPLVTIVTPYYNGGKYIEQTFNCVLNQTFPWFEWIIVDDGSTNQSDVDKVQRLAETDPRVRLVHKENGGIATARNLGFRMAATEYVLPLDCDDLIEPTFIEYCWWMLTQNPDSAWAYTSSCGFQNQEYLWNVPFDPIRLRKENHLTATSLIRKNAYEAVGGYAEVAKHFNEDWHMYLRMVAHGAFPVQSTGEYQFWYRRTDSGVLALVEEQSHQNDINQRLIESAAADVIDPESPVIYPRTEWRYEQPHVSDWNRSIYAHHDKIHITLLTAWLEMGGADRFNYDLLAGLDPERYEISVLTTVASENSWQQRFRQITPEVFNLPNFMEPKDYPEFISYFLRSRETDILFVTNSYDGYYLMPWIRMQFPRLAIVDYVHMEEWYWRAGGYARISGVLSEITERTYVCNTATEHVMVSEFGRRPDSVQTVHIGIDSDYYRRDRVRKGIVYKRLGIDEDRPIVLFICRLAPQKRPFLMLRIAERVRKEIPDVAFVVVGNGPQEQDLRTRVQRSVLEDTVYFAGATDEVRPYYLDAQVTLICSIKEGLALTAYESLAMGTPVVSADVGGQSDLIDDAVGALIPCLQSEEDEFNSHNYARAEVEQYVSSIVRILSDDALRTRMSTNGRQRIEERFSIRTMVDTLDQEFVRLTTDTSMQADRDNKASALQALRSIVGDYVTTGFQMQIAEEGRGYPCSGEAAQYAAPNAAFTWQHENRIHAIEEQLAGISDAVGRHEEVCIRHEEVVNRHEEVVNRHEEVVNRHEEIVNRHEDSINHQWGVQKWHEERMQVLEHLRERGILGRIKWLLLGQ